jgi:hypothetical protein
MHHYRGWLGVRRCTRIFAAIVGIHVPDEQVVGERLAILRELRQPRFRVEAQDLRGEKGLWSTKRFLTRNLMLVLCNYLVSEMPVCVAGRIGRILNDTCEINRGALLVVEIGAHVDVWANDSSRHTPNSRTDK